MCVWDENMCWLLCGGKHKFLLRSSWIVLTITTLIDTGAIIAYWQLAPISLDSKPGLKLSLLLLITVLLLYFFVALLCIFIIMKLTPKKRDSSRESTELNRNRAENCPASNFEPLPHSSTSYSDGIRHVLPNNAPPTLPDENSRRTDLTEAQSRRFNFRESSTRSNMENIHYYHPLKKLNMNDSDEKRRNSTQSYAEVAKVPDVPKIVVTRPENPEPIYENIESQTSLFSARSRSYLCSKSSTNVAFENKASNLPQNNFYRSVAVGRPNLKSRQLNQPNINVRNTAPTIKPFIARSKSYVDRSDINADEKQTLEMSINQSKISSRRINSHLSISSSSSSECRTTDSGASEKYKSLSSTITRSTDSFIVKSQPVVNQYRRYVVDKLPPTSNPQTQMLFKAILKSEDLFEQQPTEQAANNVPEINDILRTVVAHV